MVIYYNRRAILYLTITITLIFVTTVSLKRELHQKTIDSLFESEQPAPSVSPPELPRHPLYKPPPSEPPLEIVDNFPLAASAQTNDDIPPIPSWNVPSKTHVPEKTPLFIGFTRNWRILQQAVVSYITAGWPPGDIYVIENTGTMDANRNGLLTLQNPFYLNHTRLHDLLGVNVLVTPTLLTFAQLQNFMLWTAIENKYPAYFWSHMDVVALPYEDQEPYQSLYALAVSVLRASLDSSDKVDDETTEAKKPWALQFFAYDRLALVNTTAYEEVGGWDTQIPFYMTDCDMHERLSMAGFEQPQAHAGLVYDVSDSLDDLEVLYRKKGKEPTFSLPPGDDWGKEPPAAEPTPAEKREVGFGETGIERRLWGSDDSKKHFWVEDTINSPTYKKLMDTCDAMQRHKNEQKGGRNTWQARQGGLGVEKEPYVHFPLSLLYFSSYLPTYLPLQLLNPKRAPS